MLPNWLPAQSELTRTQQLAFSFFLPIRSQGNCTLTRPCASVQMFWPSGPTTSAVCLPPQWGLLRVSAGRSGSVVGWALKSASTRHSWRRLRAAPGTWLA
jgi:hypothetical protein